MGPWVLVFLSYMVGACAAVHTYAQTHAATACHPQTHFHLRLWACSSKLPDFATKHKVSFRKTSFENDVETLNTGDETRLNSIDAARTPSQGRNLVLQHNATGMPKAARLRPRAYSKTVSDFARKSLFKSLLLRSGNTGARNSRKRLYLIDAPRTS